VFSRPHRASTTMYLSAVAQAPRRLARFLAAMADFGRHRHALSRLDDHLLRDIGLTPEAAAAELAKPVWDVPQHWYR
jgi:uncharacterized protein YjiS (DUF1127 family)